MRQVKGSMFIMFAKAIKSDKQGTYDKFLTNQDREVLSKLILQSNWYPFETYKNCFLAVARMVAQNNPEMLMDWGREYGEATMTAIYKNVLRKKDIRTAMNAYEQVFKSQFDFGRMEGKMLSENELTISVEDFDYTFEYWYYVALGWMERTIQLVIKKEVRSEIIARSWKGAPATVFKMSWS